MTQEEHLECSNQTSKSVYDQVDDDSDKSKNITTTNQVSIAKSNNTSSTSGQIDAVDKTLYSSDKDCVCAHISSDCDKPGVKIGEVSSSTKNNNNNINNMTVITHQGSGENIREIQTKIENSEQIFSTGNADCNKEITQKDREKPKENDSVNLNKNEKDEIVDNGANKVISSSTNNNNSENIKTSDTSSSDNKNDDPFARLNALKANISNALKEVKAVLIEHGEASKEPEKKEIKPTEGDAVQFRFVKRIRKKSLFDDEEDQKTEPEKKKEFARQMNEICTPTDIHYNCEHVEENKISTDPENGNK